MKLIEILDKFTGRMWAWLMRQYCKRYGHIWYATKRGYHYRPPYRCARCEHTAMTIKSADKLIW